MNSQSTQTTAGEAVHITAGFIGITASDPRAAALTTAWAKSVEDAFGDRPTLEGDLTSTARNQLLAWLDEHGREATDPDTPTSTDGTTVVTHTDHVHTERAVLTVQTMTDGDDTVRHVLVAVDDEPMTARQARETAAALLEAADRIDGRESQVLSLPGE